MDLVKRNFKLRVIARKLLSIRPQADLVQQSLAADGAITCFSSKLAPSAWMLIVRRS